MLSVPPSMEKCRQPTPACCIEDEPPGTSGWFRLETVERSRFGRHKVPMMIGVSTGLGWEHVSVSLRHRCPTWEEMCRVKDIFWAPKDAVVQIHPPKSEYVNGMPTCLHLWRPKDVALLLPPKELVGWNLS